MMNSFEKEVAELRKLLDAIDIELAMNAEALESIELDLRFLKTELDYEAWGDSSAG